MTEIKNFIYNGMNVRTAVVNGESWFVAADICRILDIGNPSDALSRLDDDEKNTLVLTEGIPGNPEKRVVNEAGLYTLILRSRKPEARAFKRWVTHEVLPSIRKTGVYATEAILDNPDLAIAALTRLKEERNRARELAQINAAQQQQIAELRPKATYFDLVLQCRDLVSTSTIAKDYGWSANRMNQWLHEHGIQYKQGNIWLLYQAYAPMGYTSTKTFNIPDGNDVLHNRVHTYWTQKGRLFIYQLMTSEGNYPPDRKGEWQLWTCVIWNIIRIPPRRGLLVLSKPNERHSGLTGLSYISVLRIPGKRIKTFSQQGGTAVLPLKKGIFPWPRISSFLSSWMTGIQRSGRQGSISATSS